MEKDLKEIITSKTNSLIDKASEDTLMAIKTFNDIFKKHTENFLLFYHPSFKNVKLIKTEKPLFF
jgi:hypothetical protein